MKARPALNPRSAPPLVPPIPTPVPQRNDPQNFAVRADATLGALPATIDGMNALGGYMNERGDGTHADALAAAGSASSASASAQASEVSRLAAEEAARAAAAAPAAPGT